jgi:hypothetical protein
VEEALNALLDAEAGHLCGARKYERTEGRKDTRAGSIVISLKCWPDTRRADDPLAHKRFVAITLAVEWQPER